LDALKDVRPSLLDCPDPCVEWLRERQPAGGVVAVDLNRCRSESVRENRALRRKLGLARDNVMRVFLKVLEAGAANRADFVDRLRGFLIACAASLPVCHAFADLLQRAFFTGGEPGTNAHCIQTLTRDEPVATMLGRLAEEQRMYHYEGYSNFAELRVAEGRRQGLAEGVADGWRRGLAEGRAALAARRFGDEVAEAARSVMAGVSGPAEWDAIDDLLLNSASGEQFLRGLKGVARVNGSAG